MRIAKSQYGFALLEDNSLIVLRPVILNVFESGPPTPAGPHFITHNQVLVSVITPEELKEKVKNKPTPKNTEFWYNPNIWEMVRIMQSSPGKDSVIFEASDGEAYLLLLEANPDIVSRTLEFRDDFGSPIYYIRYSTRLSVTLPQERP